uniref:Reverse transcriptase zinc-binding domain-containing protein n=1 Tax=Musca domestica TaxID=7370 RepID=A0A1I8NJG6_MUSDO
MAIQDGVIQTRNYRKYIMHDNTIPNDQCRRCGAASETIAHLHNSCTILTQNHYTTIHNNIGEIIYINIIKSLKINERTTYYYKYHPKPILETDNYTIYWDRSILVNNPPDITIPNRPDMIIIDKAAHTAKIIDFAVPLDNNIVETINTKKSKYQPLSQYLKNSLTLQKIEILPIVISSLGTIPLETTKSIEKLNVHSKIQTEMQKAVLIKATSIIRETIG